MRPSLASLAVLLAGASYVSSTSLLSLHASSHGEVGQAGGLLDTSATKLILSNHLGLGHLISLKGVRESTLNQLNRFSGPQQKLLADVGGTKTSRVVVVVDGVEQDTGKSALLDFGRFLMYKTDLVPRSQGSSMEIDKASTEEINQIVRGISAQLEQDRACASKHNSSGIFYGESYSLNGVLQTDSECTTFYDPAPIENLSAEAELAQAEQYLEHVLRSEPTTAILHISALEHIRRREGPQTTEYKAALQRVRAMFELLDHSTDSASVLALLSSEDLQTARKAEVHDKRTPNNPHQKHRHQFDKRATTSSASKTSKSSASATSTGTGTEKPSGPSGTPDVGLAIPVCHTSKNACISSTNNCTQGHGTCILKYVQANSAEDTNDKRECWSCACSRTPASSDRKGKTIGWGGAACQKKDVSSPFFLLAGFTIFLLAAVSASVGLLFSIGQEDLPGVIGAGVAGPRAQR